MSFKRCRYTADGMICNARAFHAIDKHHMVADEGVREYTTNPRQYRLDDSDCELLLRARKIAGLAMYDTVQYAWQKIAEKHEFHAGSVKPGPTARLVWANPLRKKRDTVKDSDKRKVRYETSLSAETTDRNSRRFA